MFALFGEGSRLALVTWAQVEDPHWFGARIPGAFQSLELISDGVYTKYAPGPTSVAAVDPRKAYILALPPSAMP